MPHDIRRSKKLSWLLRHGATESGLAMDGAGWCEVADVLRQTGLEPAQLEDLVRTSNKQRLQLQGGRVRACQGHSAGTPVERAALEESWELWTQEQSVWHGTSRAALESIAVAGLTPQTRTHVHLTESKDSTVAKRAHVEVSLEISPARTRASGNLIYCAPNGVLLARSVPALCIVNLYPLTKATRRDVADLRRLLHLEPA
ncbi:MAG: RNA 2'-phosphotransferase [Polyangiales bacterium]